MIIQQTKRPAAECRVSSVAVAPALDSAALAHLGREGGQPHGRCPLASPSVSKWLELQLPVSGVVGGGTYPRNTTTDGSPETQRFKSSLDGYAIFSYNGTITLISTREMKL